MFVLSCVLLCFAVLGTEAMPTTTLSSNGNYQVMDMDGNYHLYWVYGNTTITFEIIARTTGYVGLGWSPKGGMAYAEIIISGVHANGTSYFQDCHGQNRNGRPNCSESQDLIPKAYREENGWTVVMFVRKLDTCRNHDGDLPIKKGTLRVIWAIGKTDILEYHGDKRGTKSIHLLGQKPAKVKMPSDVKTFDILKHDFEIPDVDTHYECEIRKLPSLKEKHHVIRYDPIITQPVYVHHVVAYLCARDLNQMANMSEQVNKSSECYISRGNTTWSHRYCQTPLFTWAVGGTNFTFPQHVGIPIGTANESHYVKFEIHYNNLKQVKSLRDSSGFRIYYTKTLRPHDAGQIATGKPTTMHMLVPPGQPDFVVYAYTDKFCTGEWGFGNNTEAKVFAVMLHSHYAGVAIKHRHFRDGVELPPLANDPSYDFNYQQTIFLPKEATIKQGDQFLIECTYDTTDRVNTTVGGFSSLQEMCLSYLYIYPRIPLSILVSRKNPAILPNFYTNNAIDPNIPLTRESLAYNIRWTDQLVEWWRGVEKKQEKHMSICIADRDNNIARYWKTNQEPPVIHKLYNPPPSPCSNLTVPASANVALPSSMILVTNVLLLAWRP